MHTWGSLGFIFRYCVVSWEKASFLADYGWEKTKQIVQINLPTLRLLGNINMKDVFFSCTKIILKNTNCMIYTVNTLCFIQYQIGCICVISRISVELFLVLCNSLELIEVHHLSHTFQILVRGSFCIFPAPNTPDSTNQLFNSPS